MARVVYDQAFDVRTLDFSNLFGDGSFSNETDTGFTVTEGDFVADVGGEQFQYFFNVPISGIVHEIGVDFQGSSLFHGTRFNVEVSQLISDRDDPKALLNDFFGGNDKFTGSNGDDAIFGYGGRDQIDGRDGRDYIVGGKGQDTLSGGQSSDKFVFTRTSDSKTNKADLITDLNDSHDTIDLHKLHVQGEITATYDPVNDVTHFMIDKDGDLLADMQIDVTGNHLTYDGFNI